MTTQDRTAIMVVVAIAAAVGAWFVLLKPEREKAAALTSQVEQARQVADKAAGAAASARSARLGYREDYATLVRLGKAVPTDDDIASFVYQLDVSARQTGVDFRSVAVTATADPEDGEKTEGGTGTKTLPGGVVAVPVTLTFEGGFFEMTRFVRKIERYTVTAGDDIDVRGRLVSIESINLSTAADGFPDVKAEVTANVYRAPLPSVDADAPGTQPAAAEAPAANGARSNTGAAGPKSAVIGVTK